MSSPKAGSKLYALSLFGIVSVACGMLVAGLMLPGVLLMSNTAKATADGLENLPAELTITPQMERSRILLKDGSVLAEFYDENRIYVGLSSISKVMRQAQVAIEDYQFYDHGAIYLQGTLRALLRNSAGGATQGGSTLTQQYVKQALIEAATANNDKQGVEDAQAQTVTRKIRELRYAVAVEKKFTKNQILERYLNIAYYGDGAYGVEAAAKHYFNTTASRLTLPQAALLAGIVQNPDAYDPVNHPQAAMHRRNVVINRMAELGIITTAQATAAKKDVFNPKLVQPSRNGCYSSRFPFICQYAYNTIVQNMTALGKTAEERKDALNRDGLTIQTVIDPSVQTQAQTSINAFVAPTDPVIAVGVTVQPSSGLITSMVQSRPVMGSDVKKGQTWINYAVEQSMGGAEGYQAGSTFKAFTTAAALNKGMSVYTSYNAPSPMSFQGRTFVGCQGAFTQGPWSPRNSTGSGTFNMLEAAARSVNTYFVQLEQHAGLCNTIKMAEAAGVKSAAGYNLEKQFGSIASFTLGSIEITPLSMASAYATFANRGVHCDPIILQSAKTKAGKAITVPPANCRQTIPQGVADGVNFVLQGVMKGRGTGAVTRIPDYQYQAGKTGTTDSAQSVWFDGYTPNMAGVGMIAADKMAPRFKGRRDKDISGVVVHGTSGSTYLQGHGGSDAGRVWRGVMKAALKGVADTPFASPPSSVLYGERIQVPDVSGLGPSGTRAALESAGFGTTTLYIDSSYPKGTYLGINPGSGSYVSMGTAITLLFSNGPAPVTTKPTNKPSSSASSSSTKPTSTTSTSKATSSATSTRTKPTGKKTP